VRVEDWEAVAAVSVGGREVVSDVFGDVEMESVFLGVWLFVFFWIGLLHRDYCASSWLNRRYLVDGKVEDR
jgi:hypothetical protein